MAKAIYKMYDVLGFPLVNFLMFIVMFVIPIVLSEFFSIDLNSKYILVPWMAFGILCFPVGILGYKYIAVIKVFPSCEERVKYIMKINGRNTGATLVIRILKRVDRDEIAKLFLSYAASVSEVLPKFKRLSQDEKYQILSYEQKYKLVNSIVYENECVKHVMYYTDASIDEPETKFFFDLNMYMNSYFKLKNYEVKELGFGEYLDD